MKKLISIFVAVLFIVCSLCACSGSDSIVGKWNFGVNTYEFKEDNTVSVSINGTLNYDGTYEIKDDKITLEVSGMLGEKKEELSYSIKKDVLTLEGDVTLTGGVDITMDFTRVEK